jgi:hypothetical protein
MQINVLADFYLLYMKTSIFRMKRYISFTEEMGVVPKIIAGGILWNCFLVW